MNLTWRVVSHQLTRPCAAPGSGTRTWALAMQPARGIHTSILGNRFVLPNEGSMITTRTITQQFGGWRKSGSGLLAQPSSSCWSLVGSLRNHRFFSTKPDEKGSNESDNSEEKEQKEGEEAGEKAEETEEEKKKKKEKRGKENKLKYAVSAGVMGLAILFFIQWELVDLPESWKDGVNGIVGRYTDLEPRSPLLPPPGMGYGQAKYTIVIDGHDLYSGKKTTEGFVRVRRPRVHFFFASLFNSYETVIWHADYREAAATSNFLERLDPYRMCHHLFLDDCSVRKAQVVKDIKLLGRDLSSVIVVTSKPEDYTLESQANIIVLKPWQSDSNNAELADLVFFFDALAGAQPGDVRDVIMRYKGHDLPALFRAKRLKWEEMVIKQHQQKQVQPAAAAPAAKSGFLSKLGY